MKPALSPQITGFLPIVLTSSATSSRTLGSVTTVRTISTKACTGAGLKKCTPMTRPGWAFAVEISVTDREEVLVARMVSSATIPSSLLEDLLLDLQRLHDRLDHEVGVPELLQRGGEADPLVQRLRVLLAQLAARDRACRGVLEVLTSAGHRVVVDLHADDGVARAGEHLGDPSTHGAQSDNADRLEVTCHEPHPATGPRGAGCVSAHVGVGAAAVSPDARGNSSLAGNALPAIPRNCPPASTIHPICPASRLTRPPRNVIRIGRSRHQFV